MLFGRGCPGITTAMFGDVKIGTPPLDTGIAAIVTPWTDVTGTPWMTVLSLAERLSKALMVGSVLMAPPANACSCWGRTAW